MEKESLYKQTLNIYIDNYFFLNIYLAHNNFIENDKYREI